MNKSELITRTAERLDADRAAAAAAVNAVLEEIEGSVARGERVTLTGFGTFDRRARAARTGRNPRTGETIQVGPSVVAVFRPGSGFKSLLSAADGVSVTTVPSAPEIGVPRPGNGKAAGRAGTPDGGKKKAAARSEKKAGKKASKGSAKKSTKKAAKKTAGGAR